MRLGNRLGGACGCSSGPINSSDKGAKSACDTRRVESIVLDGDNLIIAFDDCTFIKARRDVLKLGVGDNTPALSTDKLDELSTAISELQRAMEGKLSREDFEEKQIKNLAGDTTLTIHTLKE